MKNRFDWTKVAFFSKNYFFGLKYSIRGTYLAILVLPWVVFFLVAGMMQCFGFSMRIMLKMKKKKKKISTLGCFTCCRAVLAKG